MAKKFSAEKQETHDFYPEYAKPVEKHIRNRTSFGSKHSANLLTSLKLTVAAAAVGAATLIFAALSINCSVQSISYTSASISTRVSLYDRENMPNLTYILINSEDPSYEMSGRLVLPDDKLNFTGLIPSTKYNLTIYDAAGENPSIIKTFSFTTRSMPRNADTDAKQKPLQPKSISCTVRYYLGDTYDEANDEIISFTPKDPRQTSFDISAVEIKTFEGYTYSFLSATLPARISDKDIIEVHYTQDTKVLGANVHYYVNGIYNSGYSLRRTAPYFSADSIYVTSVEARSFDGCTLSSVSPLLPSYIPDGGVINVYYDSAYPEIVSLKLSEVYPYESALLLLTVNARKASITDYSYTLRNNETGVETLFNLGPTESASGTISTVNFLAPIEDIGVSYTVMPNVGYTLGSESSSVSSSYDFMLGGITFNNMSAEAFADGLYFVRFNAQASIHSSEDIGIVDSLNRITLKAYLDLTLMASRDLTEAEYVIDPSGVITVSDADLNIALPEIPAGEWLYEIEMEYNITYPGLEPMTVLVNNSI